MLAWLYASLHRGHPGDRAFYLAVCRGANTVLELGVGYGRLAIPLAEAGAAVTGIDLDDELLAMAATRRDGLAPEVRARIELRPGDMRDFELEGQFDRVLIPYSGLHCLLDRPSLMGCLQGVARHLAPDGRLVLDTYLADDLHHDPEAMEGQTDPEPLVDLHIDGRRYAVEESVHWQRDAQRLDTTYRAIPDDGSSPLEQCIPQRYLLIDELEEALRDAGLAIVQAHGGFDGRPLTAESELRVLTAKLS